MHGSLVSLRRPKEDDIGGIEKIAAHYDMPLVSKFDSAAVVEINENLQAFAVTRSILEAVLYCRDTDKDKVLALRKLIDQAKEDAIELGYDQFFVFVDPEFASILKKRFGFKDAVGVPLRLDL